MADSRVIGCADWTIGGGGWGGSNYQFDLLLMAEYIATVEPVEVAPIDLPIEPYQYDRIYNLLPQSMEYLDRLKIDFQTEPQKQTVGYSIDDAFITHPNLKSRTVVVWNIEDFPEFHGLRSELEAWVLEHYAPLPTIVYRELP
jgi:hypothetical protein